MSLTRKGFDKLPGWAQALLLAVALSSAIYGIIHYGFFHFLLRLIFTPEI